MTFPSLLMIDNRLDLYRSLHRPLKRFPPFMTSVVSTGALVVMAHSTIL